MSIIIMILLLGLLIFVHELGHFLTAIALGIKVSKFALGFPIGPTLWSKKIGDVEYLIHACLLGGYVAFPDDEKDKDIVIPEEEKFVSQPVWKRMIVISAGVIANVIIAFVLVVLTASIWGKLPSGQHLVFVNNIPAPASESIIESGLKDGDQILKINGSDVSASYIVTLYAKNSAEFDGKVDKDFADKNLNILKELNPALRSSEIIKAGTNVILPKNVIEPAIKIPDKELFDLQLFGDKYENDPRVSLTDEQVKLRDLIKGKQNITLDKDTNINDLAYAVSDNVSPINMTVLRENKVIELKPIYPNEKGMMGVVLASAQRLIQTKDPVTIIKASIDYLNYQTYMMCYGLYTIFTGKIKATELHGVILIAKVGGDIIHNNGLFSGLLLTAIISINLALINFLPIPALDGGHFMFLIIEKLRGKPVKQETIDKISNIFFILLIVLMILVLFNDIYALIMHKF